MNFPFASSDPNAESGGGFRPARVISCKANSKDIEDIHAGDNQMYLLPSRSNYREFAANGWQGYLPGAFFTQIRVKSFGDRFARTLRTPANNPLTEAYWKLFDALCPSKKVKGTLLDTIKENGFDAGVDHRCMLNIVRNTTAGLSRLRWFDVGAERPGTDTASATRKRLLTLIMEALMKVYENTGQQVVGFELERSALLNIGVQYNGTIAQFMYAMPATGPSGMVVSDLAAAIPDFQLEQLDEAAAWAADTDALPALDQIPALVECPQACDILGLQTTRVPGNPSQVAPGFAPPQQEPQYPPAQVMQAPPVQAPPVQAPPVQAPQYTPAPHQAGQQGPAQPVQAPPVQAPPVQAPQYTPQAPPVQAPQQAAAEPMSTMQAPSAAEASSSFAAQLNAQVQQQQGQQGAEPGQSSF